MISSSCTVMLAKPIRCMVAAKMPARIALLRWLSCKPAAASPMTTALSPASTRSIITTWKNAVRTSGENISVMRATPLNVQSDITVRLNCQRGPALDVHAQKRRSQNSRKLIQLVRLIRMDEKPDHLVRLDQNRNSDTDKGQDPGDVEPHCAGLIAPAKQRESSRRRAKRKQQRRDRRRQCIGRHYVAHPEGCDQRPQQDAGEPLFSPISRCQIVLPNNLAAVCEGHRFPHRAH